jgi:hypothetical protein
VKKRLTIALVVTALAATITSLAAAGLYQRARAQATTAADALPAYEILNAVRSLGYRPTTQALRRGPYYVLHAIDPRGIEMRVVADAQLGDIVAITPRVAPRYDGGPRIIHVPQPDDRSDRGTPYDDEAVVPEATDDDQDVAPPPRRPTGNRIETPPTRASADPLPPSRPKPESKPEPKPLGPPRAVLSAPPPAGSTALTPIYPTPKFEPRPAEKFPAPDDRSDSNPPSGYTPPGVPRD